METNASEKAQAALNAAKESLKNAGTAIKDGASSLKDKAQAANQKKMESDPAYREKVEKTEGFFDNLKDKAADLLRSGADHAKNLADKLDN